MPEQPVRQRTIIYIDGFNLFYGALKGTSDRWLDLERYFSLLRNEDDLVAINYFTTRVSRTESRRDQTTYIKALSTSPLVKVIEGRFKPKEIVCRVRRCSYRGSRKFIRLEEKRTDVAIAVTMLEDAFADSCDIFVLVSGDSDLVPAVNSIKANFPHKKVLVYVPARNPTGKHATELRSAADKGKDLPLKLLSRAQLPVSVPSESGALKRPPGW